MVVKMVNKVKDKIVSNNFHNIIKWILSNSFAGLFSTLIALVFIDIYKILIGFLCIFLLSLIFLLIDKLSDDNLQLVRIIKNDQKHKRWIEIIRFTYPLSVPLWLSGKYKARIISGKYLEEACMHLLASGKKQILLNDKIYDTAWIRSHTLIYDLGWTITRYDINNLEEGKAYILNGIYIAKENNYFPLIVQGYRCLLALSYKVHDYEYAEKYKQEIETLLSESEFEKLNIKEKNKIQAGIKYTIAAYYLDLVKNGYDDKVRLLNDAINNIDFSIEFYKKNHDLERYGKVIAVKADILWQYKNEEMFFLSCELLKKALLICESQQERVWYCRIGEMLMTCQKEKIDYQNNTKVYYENIIKESRSIYDNIIHQVKDYEEDRRYSSVIRAQLKCIIRKCKKQIRLLSEGVERKI